MSDVIVLDTGPLGLITNPKQSGENIVCYQWLELTPVQSGATICAYCRDIQAELQGRHFRRMEDAA